MGWSVILREKFGGVGGDLRGMHDIYPIISMSYPKGVTFEKDKNYRGKYIVKIQIKNAQVNSTDSSFYNYWRRNLNYFLPEKNML